VAPTGHENTCLFICVCPAALVVIAVAVGPRDYFASAFKLREVRVNYRSSLQIKTVWNDITRTGVSGNLPNKASAGLRIGH
jgi:hypothetical protein